MLMEVLISMFSAILDENSDHDEPTFLMWTAAIRTSSGLRKILEKVQRTRAKTEILLQEGSRSLSCPLVLFQQLKTRGLLSSARRVNENFLMLLRTSVLGISSPNSDLSMHSHGGSGPSWENHMRVPPGSPLQMELFLSWLDTELKLWETEVSVPPSLARRAAGTGGFPGGPLPLPLALRDSRRAMLIVYRSWKSEITRSIRSDYDR